MSKGKFRIGQFIFFLASACGLQGQDFDKMVNNLIDESVPLIYPDSLFKEKERNPSLIILDAREKKEYNVSHIENAVWVGYDDFDIEKVKSYKGKEVIIYCSVGYRSEKIGEKLQDAGFKEVKNLYGGIFGWKNKGFPVFNNEDAETEQVHAYSKSWGKWLVKGEKVYE